MKKLPLVLLAIVSLFVLAGCHGDKQYDVLLQQADSIMNIMMIRQKLLSNYWIRSSQS